MNREHRNSCPNIVPCLVLPFEKACAEGPMRYRALVFARRGNVILFAAEYARRFGVATLGDDGEVDEASQFATLDMASRAFLSRERAQA